MGGRHLNPLLQCSVAASAVAEAAGMSAEAGMKAVPAVSSQAADIRPGPVAGIRQAERQDCLISFREAGACRR